MLFNASLLAVSVLFGSLDVNSVGVGCNPDSSLRGSEVISAVQNAVNTGGAQTILLAPGCAYTLTQVNNGVLTNTNGLPVIPNMADVTIEGNGATLARDPSAPQFRFFEVEQGGRLVLNNLMITGGHAGDNTNLFGNTDGGDGGAILNRGVLGGSFVTFTNNIAGAGGSCAQNITGLGGVGGAIANWGELYLSGAWLGDNRNGSSVDPHYSLLLAQNKGSGGAVYNTGAANLFDVFSINNHTGNFLGLPPVSGSCAVLPLPPTRERGQHNLQGIIFSTGLLTITESVFLNEPGAVVIANGVHTSFYANANEFVNNATAIYWQASGHQGKVENSFFISNTTGVVARAASTHPDDPTFQIVNSTFERNKTAIWGDAIILGDSQYSALFAALDSSTFSSNECSIKVSYNNYMSTGMINVSRSVWSSNVDDAQCDLPTVHSYVIDNGYNVMDKLPQHYTLPTGITTTTSLTNVNPLLDLPGAKDNGGKTPTIALLPGSPAINFIPADACADVPTDQRGVLRPQGGKCDAGAYESLSYPRVFMPVLSR